MAPSMHWSQKSMRHITGQPRDILHSENLDIPIGYSNHISRYLRDHMLGKPVQGGYQYELAIFEQKN